MSPQRRKGRGGGAGKVMAPAPSSNASIAIDSPTLLPLKPSRQRGKTLAGILPASCKSSIAPSSTSFSAKSRSKDRSRSITTSSASSCDVLLSAAGLCNARTSSETGKFVRSTGIPPSSSSHGISRSRKGAVIINHDRASLIGSALGHARTRRCANERKGMKASMSSVLSGTSRSSTSQSCRSSLQKEDLGESLRWSTVTLPKSINSFDDADEKFLSGSSAKPLYISLSQKHSSNRPSFASSPDRRHSMGSSVMSIATSWHSGCEEALDDDIDSVRISDEYEKQRDIISDVISEVVMAWQNDMDACTCQKPKFLVESGKKCMGTSSHGIMRPSLETKEDQTFSNAHDQLNERRASLPSAISSNSIVHLNENITEGQQILDEKPNPSNSLHQRLALLEGRVSQIASELRKTKEMLDNNNPSSSVALLCDIQGKISSIEQAMTVRLHDKHSTSQQGALMEEDLHKAHIKYDTAHSDSSGEFAKSSHMMLPHKKASPDVSTVASRKTDRLESDQQKLEDRLFPHRKLLKNRLSLHERAVESRAALHSKLEEAVTPSLSVEGALVTGILQSSAGNVRDFPHFTGLEQESCTCSFKTQSVTEFDAEPHPFVGKSTSNCMNSHCFDKVLVADDPISPFHGKHLAMDGDAAQHVKVHNGKSKEPHHEKMHCALGQEPSRLANPRTQENSQTESVLKFLECDESLQLQSFDTQENLAPDDELEVDSDELQVDQLRPVGQRVATAGWYACEGEAIVLVHDDGCCSFFDVANMEEKAVYQCPKGYPAISWNDCWLIRAAGSDGRANKYIVAATSGSVLDAGFCSWDFHNREIVAHHTEDHFTWLDLNVSAQSSPIERPSEFRRSQTLCFSASSTGTGSHPFGPFGNKADVGSFSDNISRPSVCDESSQWWYRPCGALMASAGSYLQQVALYDIRDGETVMTWETKQPILCLDYSSPLQWRNRGKLALAEEQAISLWDVNALDAQCLQLVKLLGKRICAFHVHNADAELSGGVRQRLSSSDMEAFEGICCTQNDINVLDFRVPSGIALCLPTTKQVMQSVFAWGDTILVGGIQRAHNKCEMQQWSVRMGRLVCTYAFRPSSHYTHLSLTQVWGSSSAVMAVNGNGLHIFKGYKEITDGQCGLLEEEKERNQMLDLFNPSFDYANSRILLISRDRPASWCYWPS